ncbi:TetR/AcrR family transcriptional regulator C-terminal domain-containing protein [Streptomyces gilvosporeus]|uniref:GntR family transcriptional regulator n=1 Tax=Streptomyces gilvosporeus TaxID=553510 RepID=A0A1V0TTZ9_9ACTN|nr:TetR/AcrR family transcriptional regulator C-terminal domain-containing protein [Streptomyces gilvosporeus]ARF56238.1 GntR family transcriptional regulator [Streptomyces gilvosporeus]
MAVETDPPYLRIAAEIRRRITEGELAPGDRVPSTRQISREWGVALATATKALTTLGREGLVEARPRAGTVVAAAPAPVPPKRRAPADRGTALPDHELTRDRIVRAAIEIADAEGLAALTMRGVAARLGVAAMSPYRYVTGKDDLVLLMADAAFGEGAYPAKTPADWRARLELGAHTLWAVFRRHPWLAQLSPLTRPLLLPNLMVHAEWALGALDGHGLDPKTMLDLHILLYSYIQGLAVNLEQEAQAEAATGLTEEQWMDRQAHAVQAIVTSARYPVFTKVVGAFQNGYDLRLDELFAFGLEPLLDGMAAIVEGGPPRPRPRLHGQNPTASG